MKLLFFTSVFRRGSGVALVIEQQLQGLLVKGFKDLYVATSDGEEVENEIIRDHVEILNIGEDVVNCSKTIMQVRPDIVIVNTPPYWSQVAQFQDFPIIKIAQDYGEPLPSFFEKQECHVRESIDKDKYKAIGEYHIHISISDFIKRCSGIDQSIVMYLGADHVKRRVDENKTDIREYLRIPKQSFLITSLARIGVGESYYKGFDILIQIKKQMLNIVKDKDIVFLCAGRANPKGNDAEKELREVGFILLENVDESLKKDLLSQSDVFISPSLWEGFNLPLVEAQYFGTPSLCFSIGAHPEVCPFHFLNIQEMVAYLVRLYREPGLREFVGNTCMNYVKDRFRWEENVNQLIAVCERAIAQKRTLTPLKDQNDYYEKQLKQSHIYEHERQVLQDHLLRVGENGTVTPGLLPGTYKIEYRMNSNPLISIIIPNQNHYEDLRTSVSSILNKSTYNNYEILILENGTTEKGTLNFYQEISRQRNIKIVRWEQPFNYAAINNFGVKFAQGEVLLFLNNDTEVISSDWLERMLEHALREEVGAVGAKLYYPDGSIQHGGIIIGINKVGGHAHSGFPGGATGYGKRLKVIHNVSAVTAACVMIKKSVFEEVGGFDERYVLAFNDLDLCLKIREKGYKIIWTPYAELYHHECKTRGKEDTIEKQKRCIQEAKLFQRKWKKILDAGDPYYSPHLTLEACDFSLRE